MDTPIVSVICLCYNHSCFVRDAIVSVFNQTHAPVQLIVVDDASTDDSVKIIREILKDRPDVIFVALDRNQGNCKAFNTGLELATGSYIIDLAADDVLHPRRIEEGIIALENAGESYGVNFTDAELITEDGERIGFHSNKFPHATIPQGDIYKDIIGRYFLNSPTMMIRREVMNVLGGYDENLAYEDFDFLIRSSRIFFYCYTPQALIKRRIVGNSMSRQQYKRNSLQLWSTYLVCKKIRILNKNQVEEKALRIRIWYEMRKAFAVVEIRLTWKYFYFLIIG